MLASKLSGSVLILLLFNRLRKRKQKKSENKVLITEKPRKKFMKIFFCLGLAVNWIWNLLQFAPMEHERTKLINSDGISIWGSLFFIIFAENIHIFTEIIIRDEVFQAMHKGNKLQKVCKVEIWFFGVHDEFLWHFNTHSRSKATTSANASFSIVCKWLSVNCLWNKKMRELQNEQKCNCNY